MNFLVIFFILITVSDNFFAQNLGFKNLTKKETNCVDPSKFDLENKLYNYELDYDKLAQLLIKHNQLPLIDELKNDTNAFNDIDCTANKHQVSNKTSCNPIKYVEFRTDRYPNYIKNTKCDCKYCSNYFNNFGADLLREEYECLSVYTRSPVLTRSSCSSDGYYEWKTSSEITIIGCVCGYKKLFVTF